MKSLRATSSQPALLLDARRLVDDLLAMMYTHPRVYVETAVIDYILPRAEFHRYLQRIVEAGFGKRVMFGSDQMVCGRERLSARR
jgi:predicted TIM-barrel fold metal-dependent hydrolase